MGENVQLSELNQTLRMLPVWPLSHLLKPDILSEAVLLTIWNVLTANVLLLPVQRLTKPAQPVALEVKYVKTISTVMALCVKLTLRLMEIVTECSLMQELWRTHARRVFYARTPSVLNLPPLQLSPQHHRHQQHQLLLAPQSWTLPAALLALPSVIVMMRPSSATRENSSNPSP